MIENLRRKLERMKAVTNKADEGFPHVLRWDRIGRRGQKCRILRSKDDQVHVRFEDGHEALLPRRALVRKKIP